MSVTTTSTKQNFLLKVHCSTGEKFMIVCPPNTFIDGVLDRVKAEFIKHSNSRAFIKILKITDDNQFCVHESFHSSYTISTFFKSGDILKVENIYIPPASAGPVKETFIFTKENLNTGFDSSDEDIFLSNPTSKRTRDFQVTSEENNSFEENKIVKKKLKKKKKTPFEDLKSWLNENYKGKEFEGEKLSTFWNMFGKLETEEKAIIVEQFQGKNF
jgi:hypothetical protein